jgi:hypothetical protein
MLRYRSKYQVNCECVNHYERSLSNQLESAVMVDCVEGRANTLSAGSK